MAGGIDNTSRSLALFQGAAAVQGLFDYLFSEALGSKGAGTDVPLLMAPVPFSGACLHQLQPQASRWLPAFESFSWRSHMSMSTSAAVRYFASKLVMRVIR